MGRHDESRSRSRDRSDRHLSKKTHGEAKSSRSEERDRHRDKKSSKKSRERDRSRSPRKSHKDKKHKKRHSSSSSSSSSSSDSSMDKTTMSKEFLEKLENERKRSLSDRKKWKEQMKALETPEEKRRRRLLKKEAKERKRKEQMGWDSELLHYTNADNPFGDSNLLDKFVWKKKLVKEGKAEMSKEEIEHELRLKQMANREELEKVKKRRQEREAEKASRDEEMALMQRQKEAEQFQEWGKNEDQFHLEQAKLRSLIRIQDGRAKPVDLLAKYINSEEDLESVEMNEPYFYLMGLNLADLEDLVADIQVYMELEKNTRNINYWNDLLVIVDEEVRKLRKEEQTRKNEYEAAMGRREGIHTAVVQEVTNIFKGKSTSQLVALQSNIEKKIAARQEGVDISYWESLLSQLKAHIARARLRDRHQENLKRKLEILKAQQGLAAARGEEEPEVKREPVSEPEEPEEQEVEPSTSAQQEEEMDEDSTSNQAELDLLEPCLAAYESGRYSPVYLKNLEPGQVVYTEEEDEQRLEYARARIQGRSVAGAPSTSAVAAREEALLSVEERGMRKEAQKGMSADEAIFSVESTIDKPVYLWSDKYRPRKPRYFNRVHTGFEWNKYNQTHYDMDNPPPKIVQGYKFNIFYPDLINKNSTPQYTVTPCADNRDFAILRFHAGPPYEDIAFKVVNREWEYSYKKGFRSQFHNNIMQLWFHFKRYRYRR